MIVLRFPDGSERRLDDDEANRLAILLWDMAQAGDATVASAIQYELRFSANPSSTVHVPQRNAARVVEALARLS
jgi:hypothetical protein